MRYINKTSKGIKIPIKIDKVFSHWLTFYPGDVHEISEESELSAIHHGLEDTKDPITKAKEPKKKEPIKAEESSIGKIKVETKKVKEVKK